MVQVRVSAVLVFEIASASLEGDCINVEEGLSLEGEIIRYSSVSLSSTLSKNKKVEQHIRNNIHKPNALRFWVEGGVIPLYVVWLIFRYCEIFLVFPPRIIQQVVSELMVHLCHRTDRLSLTLYQKSF